jgi:hypothetical protein
LWLLVAERRQAPPPLPPARVRAEPASATILLDGREMPRSWDGQVAIAAAAPFGTLTARDGCRSTEHQLEPVDAGREVVLVLDPARAAVTLDPGLPASVQLNGAAVGTTPLTLDLDLCRANTIVLAAPERREQRIAIAAGATPAEARHLAAVTGLAPLPVGTLVLPAAAYPVTYVVDGVQRSAGAVQLTEGEHEVRWHNTERWVEGRTRVDIPAGAHTPAPITLPRLGTLVVQTYPAGCRVSLRRPGGSWIEIDETPLRREIAAGRYDVRVAHADGRSQTSEIELAPGQNPPVRASFGGGAG